MGTTPTTSTSVADSGSDAALECSEDAESESSDAESWCRREVRRFVASLRMLDDLVTGSWWMGEGVERVSEIRVELCGRWAARR